MYAGDKTTPVFAAQLYSCFSDPSLRSCRSREAPTEGGWHIKDVQVPTRRKQQPLHAQSTSHCHVRNSMWRSRRFRSGWQIAHASPSRTPSEVWLQPCVFLGTLQIAEPLSDTFRCCAGSIHAVYDLLLEYNLHIVSEKSISVDHCLLAKEGATLDSVTRVMSHPQALAQCDQYLRKLNVVKEAVDDTAGVNSQHRRCSNDLQHMCQVYGLLLSGTQQMCNFRAAYCSRRV